MMILSPTSRFLLKPREVLPVATLQPVVGSDHQILRGGFKVAPVCSIGFPPVWRTVAQTLASGFLNLKNASGHAPFLGTSTSDGLLRSGTATTWSTDAIAAILRPVYLDLMEKLSIRSTPDDVDYELDRIIASVSELCGPYVPRHLIVGGAEIANHAYKLHPLDARVKIAHYTALFFNVDDLSGSLEGGARERMLEDLRLFQMKMCDPEGYTRRYPGRGDLHPVLEEMMCYLRSDDLHPFGAQPRLLNSMVRVTLELMEANLKEQHYEANALEFTPAMPQLPRFLRVKSGISEIYAHFIIMKTSSAITAAQHEEEERFFYNSLFPMVPDLVDVIDIINDIFSFYKEVKDGETAIYLLQHASVNNMTPLECFRERVDYVVGARNRVLAIAENSSSVEYKQKVERFFQGYVWFHVTCKRYRLHEVFQA